MSITSGFVEINRSHLYYEMAGAGDPIVFLEWKQWIRLVMPKLRTPIRRDPRGTRTEKGRNRRVPGDYPRCVLDGDRERHQPLERLLCPVRIGVGLD
jgi:hypothetical protein